MSSAYSQAEYLATSTRQVEIPPTTPEHYITGLYALNLAAPEGTSGDWHDVFHWQDGAEQPRQVTLAGMGDIETTSIYGNLGIYEGKDRLVAQCLTSLPACSGSTSPTTPGPSWTCSTAPSIAGDASST